MIADIDAEHELGAFHIARVLRFTVYGDHPTEATTVAVVLDDGVQGPYRILTATGLRADAAEPEVLWREGWAAPDDVWRKLIYRNAIRIVCTARQSQSAVPAP